MLIKQTQEKLRELKLHGMLEAYERQLNDPGVQSFDFNERFGLMVDAQLHDREQRRLTRLLRAAKLKEPTASPEDIDYRTGRGLDRGTVRALLTCDWIDRNQHLLITGPTGVGKTWIGCAFGQQAARRGIPVRYWRLTRLFEDMEIARADGSLPKFRAQLARMKLLILDDWGVTPLSARNRQDLLELIDDRGGAGSILVTSQLPVEQWHEYIDEPTLADAILDRVVHRSHRIAMRGESMRKRYSGLEGGAE